MKLALATFADSANIREGMLSALSMFINQLARPEFPATLGTTLVLVIGFTGKEAAGGVDFELGVSIKSLDGTDTVAEISGRAGALDNGTGHNGNIPIVFDLSGVTVSAAGTYVVDVYLNNEHAGGFEFYATLITDSPELA